MLFVVLLVKHPVVGHHRRVDRPAVIHVRLRIILLKMISLAARVVIGGPVNLIHLLDWFLVEEHGVACLCVVFDMLLVLWVVHLALMIVSETGLMVKDVTLL